MARQKRGPHDAYAEICLTIRYKIASAASAAEAETEVEGQVEKFLDKLKTLNGGEVVEFEILAVNAEPAASQESDATGFPYDEEENYE